MKAQFAEVLSALAGALIFNGTISAGYSQVIPNQPIAKKVLKMNKNAAATIPRVPLVFEVVPARMAIEAAMPAAPNIISDLRPNFSIVKTAIQEARKYSVSLAAASIRDKNGLRPIYCS